MQEQLSHVYNGMSVSQQQSCTPLSQNDCVDIRKQLKSSFDL